MCGEKMMKAGSNCAMLGSPPRMRGKDVPDDKEASGHGITPAYAGKSIRAYVKIWNEWGSPPRMRGKVAVFCCAVGAHGITPAYAGKSHSATPCSPAVWDHPRVCGEKIMERQRPDRKGGSPPRMRGKDLRDLVKMPFVRITPAYAGKSKGVHHGKGFPEDHPRVCGEKRATKTLYKMKKGSPPRMRGKGRV